MAVIPRSMFINAAKKEEEQRISNERRVKPETTIKMLAYYKVKTNRIDDDFVSATVLERSGNRNLFDELLALNHDWIIKRIWPKYRLKGFRYFTLSSLNEQTGNSQRIEFRYDEAGNYVSGMFNYSAEKYFFLMKPDGFEIFVYEGKEIEMLAYWGCSAYTEVNKKKAIADQINYLIENAVPVA